MKKEHNIEEQYLELMKDILESGVQKGDRTGTGTISVFGRQLRHSMSLGFPLLTTKKMAYRSIFSELQWMLLGRTDLRWLLQANNKIWVGDAYKKYKTEADNAIEPDHDLHIDDGTQMRTMTQDEFIRCILEDDEFSKKFGDLGPIYGKQWRRWQGYIELNLDKEKEPLRIGSLWFDQIKRAIHELRTNPDSRRIMVNAWKVDEVDKMTLPPCHYGFQFYTRELSEHERYEVLLKKTIRVPQDIEKSFEEHNIPTRAVSLMWNQRSVDVPLGLPFNIASYAMMLMIVSRIVNMVPDELICNLGDTHIYSNQVEGALKQIERTPREFPTIEELEIIEEYMSFNWDSLKVVDYDHYPKIEFPLSN